MPKGSYKNKRSDKDKKKLKDKTDKKKVDELEDEKDDEAYLKKLERERNGETPSVLEDDSEGDSSIYAAMHDEVEAPTPPPRPEDVAQEVAPVPSPVISNEEQAREIRNFRAREEAAQQAAAAQMAQEAAAREAALSASSHVSPRTPEEQLNATFEALERQQAKNPVLQQAMERLATEKRQALAREHVATQQALRKQELAGNPVISAAEQEREIRNFFRKDEAARGYDVRLVPESARTPEILQEYDIDNPAVRERLQSMHDEAWSHDFNSEVFNENFPVHSGRSSQEITYLGGQARYQGVKSTDELKKLTDFYIKSAEQQKKLSEIAAGVGAGTTIAELNNNVQKLAGRALPPLAAGSLAVGRMADVNHQEYNNQVIENYKRLDNMFALDEQEREEARSELNKIGTPEAIALAEEFRLSPLQRQGQGWD